MRIAVKYIVGQYPQLPNISSVHNRFLHSLRLRLVPNGLLLGLYKITSFFGIFSDLFICTEAKGKLF